MNAPSIDPEQASAVGGRTLELFANTPALNRWLFSKLERHVRGDVLEIGSGVGTLSQHIVAQADSAVLSDLEPHYLASLRRTFGARPRVSVARYDLAAAPPPEIAERRFDTIVAVNVIEHVDDDHGLVRTLANLLRPGGKLVVHVPACPFAYGTLDRALGHHRRYTSLTLARLMESAGLGLSAPPAYTNLAGLIGWTVNGRVLHRQRLSATEVSLFERLVPLLRLEDHLRLPLGLGVSTAAEKAA